MLDTIMGVPAHALIVHATVVLLPLAALGGAAIALLPPLRRRYGLLVGLLALVALVLVPVTTRSGSRLLDRRSAQFGPGDAAEAGLMERHADLGHRLLPWVIVLFAGVVLVLAVPVAARQLARQTALVGGARPETALVGGAGPEREQVSPPTPAWTRVAAAVAAVVTLVGAVMTLVMVIRIGHLGAEAAWSRVEDQSVVRFQSTLR